MKLGLMTVHFKQETVGKKPQRRRVVLTARVHRGDCTPEVKACESFSGVGQAVLNPLDDYDARVGQSLALANALKNAGLAVHDRRAECAVFRARSVPAFDLVVQLRQGRRVVKTCARSFGAQRKLAAEILFDAAAAAVRADDRVRAPGDRKATGA